MRKLTLMGGSLIGLAAVSTPGLASPLPDAVPAEVFAAPPAIEGPALSPSGTKLAVKLLVNGKQTLVVTPIGAGGTPAALQANEKDVNWWRWVNDDWLLVGLGDTDTVWGQTGYITRVMAVSSDLSQVNEIDWRRSGQFADDVPWVATDGSSKFLLAKQTGFDREQDYDISLFEADAATGKAKLLIGPRNGVYKWVADGAGNVRMGYAYDKPTDKWSILYRSGGSGEFTRLERNGEPGKDIPIPLIFAGGGKAYTIHDATGFDEVYEMSLPNFALGKKIYSRPGYDVSALDLTPTRDGLAGADVVGSKVHSEWFDPRYQSVQAMLDQSFGKDNAEIVSQDRSGTKMIVTAGPPNQAGGTYFLDQSTHKFSLIGWNNPALQDRNLSATRAVRYKARDGTEIEAIVTTPRGRSPKNLPMIVMPHGGPGARDMEAFDWWAQFLAEQGYLVVQPNYRGSTGYGQKFYDLGKKQWGLKMQDDLVDAIDWAAKEGLADPKRVCIVGGSYGGYAALRGAQRDGQRYRCAISYAGVSDLKGMLSYDVKFFDAENVNSYKSYWRDQAADFATVSPLYHAADFSVPVLVAHGVKDKRVPIKQSREMVDALQKAGKTVVYLEQREGDHHFTREADRLEFLNAMKSFLDQYNPA